MIDLVRQKARGLSLVVNVGALVGQAKNSFDIDRKKGEIEEQSSEGMS